MQTNWINEDSCLFPGYPPNVKITRPYPKDCRIFVALSWIGYSDLLLFTFNQNDAEQKYGLFAVPLSRMKRVTSKPKRMTCIILLRLWRSWPVNAGSLQGAASKDGASVAAALQEELGGEVGSREATAAKEKIGLSLKGGLKHGVTAGSNLLSLSLISLGSATSNGKSASSLIIQM